MGEIIAVASQKGGVGKTTTAINLGASLAILNRRVLIVDMDPQGSVAAGFHLNESRIHSGIFEIFIENAPLVHALHPTSLDNLDVVPANVRNEEQEITLFRYAMEFTLLKQVLEPFRNNYDFVLIDCPPSLGSMTINALTSADSLLVPVQCEYYSLKSLGKFIRAIKNISRDHNPGLAFKGFLITMFDKRLKKSKEIATELRYSFKKIVFDTVIPRNSKVSESPGAGKPVALYDISSPGAISYLQLAEELLNSGVTQSKF